MMYLLITYYEEGDIFKVAVKFVMGKTTATHDDIKYFKEPESQGRLKRLLYADRNEVIVVQVEEIFEVIIVR